MKKVRAKSTFETFYTLWEKLENNEKLFFTRFGDGEVVAMMGKDHRNYKTSEGLVKELQQSFFINDPKYLMALSVNFPYEKNMTPGIFAPYPQNDYLQKYLEENNLLVHDIYENHFMFHYMSVFYGDKMFRFFEKFIRPRKKMFIGSTTKESAEKLYGKIDYYIEVPSRHAYDSIDTWWPQIEKNYENVELVIPSAGAASNVISKRLWYKNANIHLLDIGSIIDAVEEKKSRIWVRLQGHKIKNVLPKAYRNEIYTNEFLNFIHEMKYLYRKYIKKKLLSK